MSSSSSSSTADRLQRLSAAVALAAVPWALLVPTDPDDAEWIVKLGRSRSRIEVVADTLDGVLDLALGEI